MKRECPQLQGTRGGQASYGGRGQYAYRAPWRPSGGNYRGRGYFRGHGTQRGHGGRSWRTSGQRGPIAPQWTAGNQGRQAWANAMEIRGEPQLASDNLN